MHPDILVWIPIIMLISVFKLQFSILVFKTLNFSLLPLPQAIVPSSILTRVEPFARMQIHHCKIVKGTKIFEQFC